MRLQTQPCVIRILDGIMTLRGLGPIGKRKAQDKGLWKSMGKAFVKHRTRDKNSPEADENENEDDYINTTDHRNCIFSDRVILTSTTRPTDKQSIGLKIAAITHLMIQ